MPPENVPIEKVGGPKDAGPWESSADELAVGNSYTKAQVFEDGQTRDVTVTVTDLAAVKPDTPGESEGQVVVYQYNDPTDGGGN